ncbi:polyprenyl synthetase family protein [Streptomyces sp. GC420]|uniref:polyprenyl synthetase family protein n=1 Tax=Streptomyces sp. GC420 TaxID=2697568 RepID=UPI001414E52D|nr:polyprenyl synthetase family protein [Streptomyces sp. GC420]NBM16966.1 polyprenyl synthetase family protein [Streptomyces sp. GC420]
MGVLSSSASLLTHEGDHPSSIDAPAIDTSEIRVAVDAVLAGFLDAKLRDADTPALSAAIGTLRGFVLAGGKRIRPVLCVCGWYAGRGEGDLDPVLRAAASLELFHAFALIHDDVMDGSATRRGQPSVHRALADIHRRQGGRGDADRFGSNAAVLLGDLTLVWSYELLHTAGLAHDRERAATAVLDAMRTEVMLGQYLDLLGDGGAEGGEFARALAIARYKTAKYTVERPLHLGAVLAGADSATTEACTDFALPVGEAFQFRDDLLGVFGDPLKTGKPVVDDLREGKHTVLMAIAAERASPSQLRLLEDLVGDQALDERQAGAVRAVLEETGARQEVERMITDRHRMALAVLGRAPFPPAVTATMRRLARSLCARVS